MTLTIEHTLGVSVVFLRLLSSDVRSNTDTSRNQSLKVVNFRIYIFWVRILFFMKRLLTSR